MIAVDTNILARFIIDDLEDSQATKQREIAKVVLQQDCFISLTVILEFVWVMFARYQLSKQSIHSVITLLCETSHLVVEHANHVQSALTLFLQGMDFADALHLVQSKHCDSFYTFDKKLYKKASALYSYTPVLIPQ